jgi:hypothetical protein
MNGFFFWWKPRWIHVLRQNKHDTNDNDDNTKLLNKFWQAGKRVNMVKVTRNKLQPFFKTRNVVSRVYFGYSPMKGSISIHILHLNLSLYNYYCVWIFLNWSIKRSQYMVKISYYFHWIKLQRTEHLNVDQTFQQ